MNEDLEAVFLNNSATQFNHKSQYFSEYVANRNSPISALITSFAGSCTCGTKKYCSAKADKMKYRKRG